MRVAIAALLYFVACASDAAERADITTAVGVGARPAMIKIMTEGPQSGCRGNGTAFFIQPDGVALTASHVIPSDCENLTIRAQVEGDAGTSAVTLIRRSVIDGALIKVDSDKPRHYLPLKRIAKPEEVARHQDQWVTVVGFDLPDEPHSYATPAQITAVRIEGDEDRWSLSMSGANPGRSGGPVILDDGSVVAVLVELPKINQAPTQGRARVIPISRFVDLEVPMLAVAPQSVSSEALRVNLGLQATLPGKQPIDKHTVAMKDDEVVELGTDRLKHLSYATQGYNIRRRVTQAVTFKPKTGYRFVLESVRFSPLSISPRNIEPKSACIAGIKKRCWEIVDGVLVVHLELFPGNYDGADSWIEGELATEQVRAAN